MTSIEDARKSWEKETEKSLTTFQGKQLEKWACNILKSIWAQEVLKNGRFYRPKDPAAQN